MNGNRQLFHETLRKEPLDPEFLRGAHPWQPDERRASGWTVILLVLLTALGVFSAVSAEYLFSEDRSLWLAAPLLLLPLFGFVVIACELVRQYVVGRCPRCDNSVADLDNVFSFRRIRWCSNCDLLLRPEDFETTAGQWCINGEEMLAESDPAVKCLSMWMLLSMCDRVDELSFVPEQDDYHCRITIGDEVHEMDPLAARIHRCLVAMARAIWGCDPKGDSQITGKIVVSCAGRSATVSAEFTPSDAGERVVFRFSDHHPLN